MTLKNKPGLADASLRVIEKGGCWYIMSHISNLITPSYGDSGKKIHHTLQNINAVSVVSKLQNNELIL